MEQVTQALLARHPQSTFGWSVLGTALQLQGKSPIDAWERLIALAPHDAEAHTHLGDALQNAGDPQASLPLYLRAIELAPQYATAHCNLGSALDALGRQAEAQQSYRRALGADPGNLAAHSISATACAMRANTGRLLPATALPWRWRRKTRNC